MKNGFQKIFVWINLIGLSKIERQSLEILIFLKEMSEADNYGFSYDSIVKKRLSSYFNGVKNDIFSNLKQKPLKQVPGILFYLTSENYIEKRLNNTYVFTNHGLNKVYSLESFSFVLGKFVSTIGTIGGFVYALGLLKPLLTSLLGWLK